MEAGTGVQVELPPALEDVFGAHDGFARARRPSSASIWACVTCIQTDTDQFGVALGKSGTVT